MVAISGEQGGKKKLETAQRKLWRDFVLESHRFTHCKLFPFSCAKAEKDKLTEAGHCLQDYIIHH